MLQGGKGIIILGQKLPTPDSARAGLAAALAARGANLRLRPAQSTKFATRAPRSRSDPDPARAPPGPGETSLRARPGGPRPVWPSRGRAFAVPLPVCQRAAFATVAARPARPAGPGPRAGHESGHGSVDTSASEPYILKTFPKDPTLAFLLRPAAPLRSRFFMPPRSPRPANHAPEHPSSLRKFSTAPRLPPSRGSMRDIDPPGRGSMPSTYPSQMGIADKHETPGLPGCLANMGREANYAALCTRCAVELPTTIQAGPAKYPPWPGIVISKLDASLRALPGGQNKSQCPDESRFGVAKRTQACHKVQNSV